MLSCVDGLNLYCIIYVVSSVSSVSSVVYLQESAGSIAEVSAKVNYVLLIYFTRNS